MFDVTCSLQSTPTPLPDGVTYAYTQLQLSQAGVLIQSAQCSVDVNGDLFATFAAVVDGAYDVTATALDASGATIGLPVTVSFDHTAGVVPATYPAVSGILFTFSA